MNEPSADYARFTPGLAWNVTARRLSRYGRRGRIER
jgi:hypothetical protein